AFSFLRPIPCALQRKEWRRGPLVHENLQKLMEYSEFTPFQNFSTFDMKNTKPTPPPTATLFSEADHVALETFLAGLIEQAEEAAETCVALHDQMTAAEWAELDAALDQWLEARAKADSKAA
ncbi:MAG: hypothetical protein ORN83_05635, partial [Chthoniobacteraceae bacterium]|nr:hypothetical protein [Chthoniobacteraceae bacterium]